MPEQQEITSPGAPNMWYLEYRPGLLAQPVLAKHVLFTVLGSTGPQGCEYELVILVAPAASSVATPLSKKIQLWPIYIMVAKKNQDKTDQYQTTSL